MIIQSCCFLQASDVAELDCCGRVAEQDSAFLLFTMYQIVDLVILKVFADSLIVYFGFSAQLWRPSLTSTYL